MNNQNYNSLKVFLVIVVVVVAGYAIFMNSADRSVNQSASVVGRAPIAQQTNNGCPWITTQTTGKCDCPKNSGNQNGNVLYGGTLGYICSSSPIGPGNKGGPSSL